MRILFMGTPEIAAVILRTLYESGEGEIIGAVTQPDRPRGRGMKLTPSPVKTFAEERGIPVLQPDTLKNGSFLPALEELAPELIIVAAYGKILPKYLLEFPPYGCVCAHASLLPRHRGAAPINRAVMEGDEVTGITAIYMDEGIDTGDMILKIEVPIGECDTAGDVHDKLAEAGGRAMVEAVRQIKDGTAARIPQPEEGASYAAKLTREDGRLCFSSPARELYNKIRGLAPAPCAWTVSPDGKLLKLADARIGTAPGTAAGALPGTVVSVDGGCISVMCGDGRTVDILRVIPEGKGRMSAGDYIRGRKINVGNVLP